jgi:hypothetical protein
MTGRATQGDAPLAPPPGGGPGLARDAFDARPRA